MAFFIFTTKTLTAETISGYRGLVMNNLVGRLFCLLSFIVIMPFQNPGSDGPRW